MRPSLLFAHAIGGTPSALTLLTGLPLVVNVSHVRIRLRLQLGFLNPSRSPRLLCIGSMLISWAPCLRPDMAKVSFSRSRVVSQLGQRLSLESLPTLAL